MKMNPNNSNLLYIEDFSEIKSPSGQINTRTMKSPENDSDPLQELLIEQNLSSKETEPKQGTPTIISFWSIEYYQQFFNVDTNTVINRIASGILPKRAPRDYLKSEIGLNPDLYGPFWITVTLIFSIAISGDIANYLQQTSPDHMWKYKFQLVSYAAFAIFIYGWLVPIVLWAVLKWSVKPINDDIEAETTTYSPKILSLICVYGYSLSIYIPVSILWVIQNSILQWTLVVTAAILSASVLLLVLMPAIRNSHLSLFLILGILAAHLALAAGFMLVFVHYPTQKPIIIHQNTSIHQ